MGEELMPQARRIEMAPLRHTDPKCSFLRRDLSICTADAVVMVDYGSGRGACTAHIAPIVLFAMEKQGRGGYPESSVTVVPAWRWQEHQEALAASEHSQSILHSCGDPKLSGTAEHPSEEEM